MTGPLPYEVDLTKTARRALAEQLPLDVAVGVSEFLVGPLADNPRRVGKELDSPLAGVYSARVMRGWRVLHRVEWHQARPPLDPVRWVAARIVDDAAYGWGLWNGCFREREWGPVLPDLGWRLTIDTGDDLVAASTGTARVSRAGHRPGAEGGTVALSGSGRAVLEARRAIRCSAPARRTRSPAEAVARGRDRVRRSRGGGSGRRRVRRQ